MNHLKIQAYIKVVLLITQICHIKYYWTKWISVAFFNVWLLENKAILGIELYNSICQSVCPNESLSIENWYHSKAKLI